MVALYVVGNLGCVLATIGEDNKFSIIMAAPTSRKGVEQLLGENLADLRETGPECPYGRLLLI